MAAARPAVAPLDVQALPRHPLFPIRTRPAAEVAIAASRELLLADICRARERQGRTAPSPIAPPGPRLQPRPRRRALTT